MALEALIFDVDGTLADTEREGHRVAYNAAFREAGLDWNWDVAVYGDLLAVAGGKERIRHYITGLGPGFRVPGDLDEFVATLHAIKTRYFTDLVASGAISLRPGVKRLLGEAREARLRLAIATTTAPENVEALLKHGVDAGAVEWFEVIAAGDVVAAKKPAADIYHYVLERMNLTAEAALAIEDSHNGLVAARGVGLKTVITVSTYTRNEDFTGAAIVLDHLGDPGNPCKVLCGPDVAGSINCVDVPLLRRLHALA